MNPGALDGSATLPRQEMLNLLVEDLSPDSLPYLHVHFNKKLVSYDQDGDGVIVRFEDGSSAHGDILVGADGIASGTRKTMYTHLSRGLQTANLDSSDYIKKYSLPSWIGTYAYRAQFSRGKLANMNSKNIFLNNFITVSTRPNLIAQ